MPVVSEIMPGSTLPTPIAPAYWSRQPTTKRHEAGSPKRRAACGSIGPKSVPARTIAGKLAFVDLESRQHLGLPLAAMDVDQAGQPRRARFRDVLAGQKKRQVVADQAQLARLLPDFGRLPLAARAAWPP